MIEHRVRGEPHLAGDAQPFGLGFDAALECDAVLRAERFHAVEVFQKIEMPHGAAELAVGGAAQSYVRLPRDDLFDSSVFDGAQIVDGDLTALAAGARIFQRGGAEQAADVVGAKRRSSSGHNCSPGSVKGSPV